MSRGARFVRFYPSDWRSGCIGLNLEEQGLYIAICAYIYETGKRVPLCDAAAAKILMVQVQKYGKVLKALVSAGKVSTHEDGHTVGRAEYELLKAQGAPSVDTAGPETAVERRADQGRQGTPRPYPVGQPQQPPPNQPTGGGAEKTQSFLRATKEPITNSQTQSARARGNSFWKNSLNPQADHGVQATVDGGVILLNGTRAEWLEKFGGDAVALDLALGELSIQPESREGLRKQVERQLSRIARMRHDSDKRYQQSKSAPRQAEPTAHRVSPDTVRYARPKLEPQPWDNADA
jgi:uncharacterized protein YdaU (DUF1376 family)